MTGRSTILERLCCTETVAARTPSGQFQRLILITIAAVVGCGKAGSPSEMADSGPPPIPGPVIAKPGGNLQDLLDKASMATKDRRLILRPGVYRSPERRFCLLALTSKHDGVTIEGERGAVLSGRLRDNDEQPAVSHVVYCGDGLTSKTLIRGLTISDASAGDFRSKIPREDFGRRASVLRKGLFFLLDGGAVKVFGKSSPTFEDIEFRNNETQLCGGAVSIEHQGFYEHPVTFRNCRFDKNRCPGTGSAIDVLQGSAVRIDNCLFTSNIANYGMAEIAKSYQLTYNEKHGCGALTVFPQSFAWVSDSTFIANWNGVDDRGSSSRYQDCVFAMNDAADGSLPGHPYELDIIHAEGVTGCFFFSDHPDLRGTIPPTENELHADDPRFDESFVPTNPKYADVGFRSDP